MNHPDHSRHADDIRCEHAAMERCSGGHLVHVDTGMAGTSRRPRRHDRHDLDTTTARQSPGAPWTGAAYRSTLTPRLKKRPTMPSCDQVGL